MLYISESRRTCRIALYNLYSDANKIEKYIIIIIGNHGNTKYCKSNTAGLCSGYVHQSQQTQNILTTFSQRRPNVFDVVPTLYKCYTNVLCLLGVAESLTFYLF